MRKLVLVLALGPVALAAAAASVLVLPSSCLAPDVRAEARRVTSRYELIGGPRALGELGDWLLENDQIRVIVQDEGFSRGFAVFGGSLIDADLVRGPGAPGDSEGGQGRDNFGEMFPAFFLEALEPSEVNDPNNQPGETNRLPAIEIENDGTNGEPAVLVVRGYGNDFIALTQQINEALLDDDRQLPRILFENRYILRPGARYLELETKVQNVIFGNEQLTWTGGQNLVGQPIPTPFGDVALFGGGNKVFLPHEAGYDLRYRLEKIYRSGEYTLPALPGLVADFVASTGEGVSYGILGDPETPEGRNYPESVGQFAGAKPHSVHIPFIASAFTGVFHVVPPVLEPNDRMPGGPDEFTFKRYFIIGSGDVASISDVVFEILGAETGLLAGELVEDGTRAPVEGAHVVVHRLDGSKLTECGTDDQGRFRANLPPGDYQVRVRKTGRAITPLTDVSVAAGQEAFVRLSMPAEARIAVTVSEPGVGRVPAKVTLVGTAPEDTAGADPRDWLFDLSLGEAWRYTDLVPDSEDPATRRYIEGFAHAAEGQVTFAARPGTYTVVVTRGPEYSRVEQVVTLAAGETVSVSAELHRVLETPNYIAADFHLHTRLSLDSGEPVPNRLVSYAAEGLEYVVSTDHNFVVDYHPQLLDLGYERLMNSAVGLELTTIDRGHFNGFPLRLGTGEVFGADESGAYDGTLASRTFGSFQWARKTPQQVFDSLRGLGMLGPPDPACVLQEAVTWPYDVLFENRPLRENTLYPAGCPRATERVVVQVNHPRDSILGYFEQYGLSQDTLETSNASGLFVPSVTTHPEFDAANFSWDFDAIEAFNGKRYDFLRNYLVPEGVTLDPVSCCPVTPGAPLREFRKDLECDPELRDCTCTPADTDFQIAEGNCQTRGLAFPGAIDDWMAILATGKRVVGTANSDSHESSKEEPGYPRTYVRVPDDRPAQVTPLLITAGVLSGDVLMTNGPFVEVSLNGSGMGQVVDLSGGGTLNVRIQATPWVVPNKLRVIRNEVVIEEIDLAMPMTGDGARARREESVSVDLDAGDDGFLVVEVLGTESIFPSTFPNEEPALQFSDVLGAIGSSFGFGTNPNELKPSLTYQVTPYAMTNPIFIDADGDGEVTPSRVVVMEQNRAPRGPSAGGPEPLQALSWRDSTLRHFERLPVRQQAALARLPQWLWPTRHPSDVRRVLWQFVAHAHAE